MQADITLVVRLSVRLPKDTDFKNDFRGRFQMQTGHVTTVLVGNPSLTDTN